MSRFGATVKAVAALLPAPIDLQVVEALRWLVRPETRRWRSRTNEIFEKLGRPQVVLGGPFAGMRYHGPGVSAQGGYLPKLLGCYELECHPAIALIIQRAPETVVNVGAAEGYYAVGLLTHLRSASAICFEVETTLHGAIRWLARHNGAVGRLAVHGACTRPSLYDTLARARRTVIVSDCEGAEDHLLAPDAIPRLREAAILVEVHEQLVPGVSSRLRERFAPSHSLTVFESRARERTDAPAAGALSPDDFSFAMGEGRRSVMQWFLLQPHGW